MSVAKTGIEWTDSTWNPTTGCTKVSAGCDHCYADFLAQGKLRTNYLKRLPVLQTAEAIADPFALRLWPERLTQPASWKDPRRIFVNSMSDLFHHDVPDAYLRQIWEVMLRVDRHVYQVLTKRPARAARWLWNNLDLLPGGQVPHHIWIGTSVEDQSQDYRIRHLLETPHAVRFLSCEPLLGELDIRTWLPKEETVRDFANPGRTLTRRTKGIDWVIVGGESGNGARPMDVDWVRSLRDQCAAAGVPYFFKQVGGRTPKAGGRYLDGRTWDEFPQTTLEATC